MCVWKKEVSIGLSSGLEYGKRQRMGKKGGRMRETRRRSTDERRKIASEVAAFKEYGHFRKQQKERYGGIENERGKEEEYRIELTINEGEEQIDRNLEL